MECIKRLFVQIILFFYVWNISWISALERGFIMILIDDQIISPILVKSLQELNVPVFKQGNRSEMSKSLQLMDANDFFQL